MKCDSNDVLGLLLRLPADIVLVALAGFLSISTTIHFYRSAHARDYAYFLQDGYDLIGISLTVIAAVGLSQLAVAVIRLRGHCRLTFNKYLVCLVALLMCNFVVGIILTEFRSKIADSLESIMRPKLQESIITQRGLGVGYLQAERWDQLQIQMSCCGVEGYHDYVVDKKPVKEQSIPMSCCVMRRARAPDGSLVAENPSQCMLDATHRVRQSIFLHVQGCRSPLARWAVGHTSQMTAMVFASICFQAVTLLYLSWQGYQRQNAVFWR